MKITIVIPVYNGETYIQGALDSCLLQTYREIEILIVNDGSTDSTLSIIEEYELQDSRINHINQSNQGLVRARKTGVENVKTDFFVFLDSDDKLTPNAIQNLVENYNETKADIIFSNFTIELENGKILASSNNKFYNSYESISVLNNILLKNIAPTIWGKLVKRELFQKIDTPDDITIGEDAVSIVQLLCLNPSISSIDSNIYRYIQRRNSMVNINDKKKNFKRIYLISYLKDYVLQHFKSSDSIENSLKCFLLLECFDVLRDGGVFSDISNCYKWCTSTKSIYAYKRVLGLSRVFMLVFFSRNYTIGMLYRRLYNSIRKMKYSL